MNEAKPDPTLREANRAAHAAGRAARDLERVARSYGPFSVALTNEFHAVLATGHAYAEAEARARREAPA